MALAAGDHIGRYEILGLLGAGGMGEVYKAHDNRLQRVIALKILAAEKVAEDDRRRRFLVEAQAASKLNHPNIVAIYDVSEENGVCFIAMEYVAGATLEQANVGIGLPLKQAMKYAAEIADAIVAAHSAGIIHRDLKPANIIITQDDRVKLLDFGLAKLKSSTHFLVPVIFGCASARRRAQDWLTKCHNLRASDVVLTVGEVLAL